METKDYRKLFLEKSLLGRDTKLDDSDEVILKCIRLAYRDMLKAGRFYLVNDTKNNIETRCSRFKAILEKVNYVYSRKIIDEILPLFVLKEEIHINNRYATRYGLSQKLVNMTYKYFYVFKNYINKNIDFSNCDCPLDSIILCKLKLESYTWSKLTETEYEYCQHVITKKLQEENELKSLGNLAYDFLNW